MTLRHPMRISVLVLALLFLSAAAALGEGRTVAKAEPALGKLLKDVKASKIVFDPAAGQNVTLEFILTQKARVTVKVWDADLGLVDTLVQDRELNGGRNFLVWKGRDLDGRVVPDEAYFFTVVATAPDGTTEVFDPIMFSGGVEHEIEDVDLSKTKGTVSYVLPEPGRVSVRVGTKGGPLFTNLSNWIVRAPGRVTQFWNGTDEDGLYKVWDDPRFKMVILYFTLPDTSVITYGNKEMDYAAYKTGPAKNRPKKEERTRVMDPSLRISSHFALNRVEDRGPGLVMTFPKAQGTTKEGLPILKGRTIVHVTLHDKDKARYQSLQYEISFFLDGAYFAEEEVGYAPYNWVWDTRPIPEGEHLLTVNLSSFSDQLGVISKKVWIAK